MAAVVHILTVEHLQVDQEQTHVAADTQVLVVLTLRVPLAPSVALAAAEHLLVAVVLVEMQIHLADTQPMVDQQVWAVLVFMAMVLVAHQVQVLAALALLNTLQQILALAEMAEMLKMLAVMVEADTATSLGKHKKIITYP
jgi:hypothetical protein